MAGANGGTERSSSEPDIGDVAHRLAHDFTNQFGVIRNFAELAAEDLNDPERVRDDLISIQEAAERGLEMAARVLALGGRGVDLPSPPLKRGPAQLPGGTPSR